MGTSTTYLTSEEARDYLRFTTIRALYRWASANAIPKCRRGRSMLFLRRDLDEAVGNNARRGNRRPSALTLRGASMTTPNADARPLNSLEAKP